MNIQPGSVSCGTLRREDLIPAFVDVLLDIEPYNELGERMNDLLNNQTQEQFEEYVGSDDAYWDLDELFDELDELCGPTMYFGAHPDDPADFGFWFTED